MVITYYGMEFFKVQFGDLTLALNPVSKDSKLKSSRFGADVVLVSMNTEDFNGSENMSYGDRTPFVINGPGEYEIKDVFIKGISSGANPQGKLNTIYTIALEGMNLVFLGALASKDLSADIKGALPDIDILFVPIGGGEVLTSNESYRLAVSLEPKVIIPMHYGDNDEGVKALKAFLKEAGAEAQMVEKFTVKRKDLEGKQGEIVVLAPAS